MCLLLLRVRMESGGLGRARVGEILEVWAGSTGGNALVGVISSPFPLPATAGGGTSVFKRKGLSVVPDGLSKGWGNP